MSLNGPHYAKGCQGAVWSDGSPSPTYCNGDGPWPFETAKYPWYHKCCLFNKAVNECRARHTPKHKKVVQPHEDEITTTQELPLGCYSGQQLLRSKTYKKIWQQTIAFVLGMRQQDVRIRTFDVRKETWWQELAPPPGAMVPRPTRPFSMLEKRYGVVLDDPPLEYETNRTPINYNADGRQFNPQTDAPVPGKKMVSSFVELGDHFRPDHEDEDLLRLDDDHVEEAHDDSPREATIPASSHDDRDAPVPSPQHNDLPTSSWFPYSFTELLHLSSSPVYSFTFAQNLPPQITSGAQLMACPPFVDSWNLALGLQLHVPNLVSLQDIQFGVGSQGTVKVLRISFSATVSQITTSKLAWLDDVVNLRSKLQTEITAHKPLFVRNCGAPWKDGPPPVLPPRDPNIKVHTFFPKVIFVPSSTYFFPCMSWRASLTHLWRIFVVYLPSHTVFFKLV